MIKIIDRMINIQFTPQEQARFKARTMIRDLFSSLADYANRGLMKPNQLTYLESAKKDWISNNELPERMELSTLKILCTLLDGLETKKINAFLDIQNLKIELSKYSYK